MAKKRRTTKGSIRRHVFSLESLLQLAGREMAGNLRARLVPHKGELGREREGLVRDFLAAYLPKRFEISTGFAFDSRGAISDQLDVIIADASIAPRFEGPGGTRFVPCESIVAVGQVRSSVRSRRELATALTNLESAKALDRSAGGKAIDERHGEAIDPQRNHLHQIFTFLLITGPAMDRRTAQYEFMQRALGTAPHLWTNVVVALDKYLLTFCCDGGVCPNPLDARGVALQEASKDDDLLMRFYIMLGGAVEITRISGFPYWEYLHTAREWSAEVYFSAADDPPPYLSAIARY